MNLLPEEIAREIPRLRSQQKSGEDAIAHVRLVASWMKWSWFVSEYEPKLRVCFGVVINFDRRLDYFSLDKLEDYQSRRGLRIERDPEFTPRPLKDCE